MLVTETELTSPPKDNGDDENWLLNNPVFKVVGMLSLEEAGKGSAPRLNSTEGGTLRPRRLNSLENLGDEDNEEEEEEEGLTTTLLFFLQPPPIGTLRNAPPLVQYLLQVLQ